VIPREGVERRGRVIAYTTTLTPVIPREGVESSGNIAAIALAAAEAPS